MLILGFISNGSLGHIKPKVTSAVLNVCVSVITQSEAKCRRTHPPPKKRKDELGLILGLHTCNQLYFFTFYHLKSQTIYYICASN